MRRTLWSAVIACAIAGCAEVSEEEVEGAGEQEAELRRYDNPWGGYGGGCPSPDLITYETHVKPILNARCTSCHVTRVDPSWLAPGGLQLDSYDHVMDGATADPHYHGTEQAGSHGVIKVGDGPASLLYKKISGKWGAETPFGARMPPGCEVSNTCLDPCKTLLIEGWIQRGAQ